MNELNASTSNQDHLHQHVAEEDALLEALRVIWIPHRLRDLKVRYEMGVLLNQKLGVPTVRQSYGQGTIQRVSKELNLDKSDISRMRRFAHQYESFETFQQSEPTATSWHKVRELVTSEKPSNHSAHRRAPVGMLRSVEASIKALRRRRSFTDPEAVELRSALQQLYRLAITKLGFELVGMTQKDQQMGA